MRMWQFIGLNYWAKDLLESQTEPVIEKGVIIYSDDREEPFERDFRQSTYKSEAYTTIGGMFEGEETNLWKYTFKDGRIYEEYVQAEPWSSGPCTFTAFRNAVTKEPVEESLWSQEEIDNA